MINRKNYNLTKTGVVLYYLGAIRINKRDNGVKIRLLSPFGVIVSAILIVYVIIDGAIKALIELFAEDDFCLW